VIAAQEFDAVQPVRVLLIAPSLEIVGGQSVQADRLLTALRAEPSVHIEFLPINPRLPGFLRALQKVKYVRTAVTTLWYCLKLLRATRRSDVLHVFAATGPSFFMHPVPAMFAGKMFGKKTILNFRDGRVDAHMARYPRFASWVARFDEVVTPSEYLVEVFTRRKIRARSIPNLIDVERFTFRKRIPPQPKILHNRALEPLYNVACTVRAFALIQQRYPEATLTLAHDGPLRGELEKLASDLGLRGVHFIGYVSREHTARVLDESDIYLTSPNIDNMPGSLLECFAAGLPVVATRAGGIPWVVSDARTGLLVDCNDHQALANAAMRLIEEPNLSDQLTAAARDECEKYRWPSVRDGWLNLYHHLRRGAEEV
jgi:glycosyltransferase involved in cell wall biosynthesis